MTVVEAPPRPVPAPPRPAQPVRRRLPGPLLAVGGVFLAAFAYHALWSRGHLTPAIFTDELLFSKLAQSLAAGDGLTVRGEPLFFPSVLAAFAQAPAWLVGDTPTAYALAKTLNAAVMSAAAFPAYWLARRVVQPRSAVLAAAATVAMPAMLYHGYLMSEATALPVLLLAVLLVLRALERPSWTASAAAVAVCFLAVATRAQFAAVPLAYAAAVAVRGRSGLRAHAAPLAVLAVAGLGALAAGGVLGPYLGAATLGYDLSDIARYALLTLALVPFEAGWLVLPGALLGLVLLVARPRSPADRDLAAVTLTLAVAFPLGAGVVGAADAARPLERYAFYLAPLLVVAFLACCERGATRRRPHAALAVATGAAAWLYPFPSLADAGFAFDSPVLAAYGQLAAWTSHADAATAFSGGAFAAGIVVALTGARHAVGVAAVVVSLAIGASASVGDHRMTERALSTWSAPLRTWVDRAGAGGATMLALPGAPPFFAWTTEAWNRDVDELAVLGSEWAEYDDFALREAQVRSDGVLLVDGRPKPAGLVVVNDYGTQIDLEGVHVATGRPGLRAIRVPAAPRVRSLAAGLFFDGFAGPTVRVSVWPERPSAAGAYRLVLELPTTFSARTVTLEAAGSDPLAVRLRPGERRLVELPVRGFPVPPLYLRSDRADYAGAGTPSPRAVSVRVRSLEYAPEQGRAPATPAGGTLA